MPDQNTPNYPDVLGYITGGVRHNVNVVQVALAVRPRVIRAGRAFEVILLVQNASDVNVDLVATLKPPERDAQKQKGRFISKNTRLVVGLRPAEAGYVKLPMSCLPDTAVSNDYRMGMQVAVKPLSKPSRIRHARGGGPFEPESLADEDMRAEIADLNRLHFSADKPFGLGDTIEVPFAVMPGRIGKMADFQPGWVSLWTTRDMEDERALVARYASLMLATVLPQLHRSKVIEPLMAETTRRFEAAGYPLKEYEALYIAKMLARILDMAAPQENVFDYLANPEYNVALTLKSDLPEDGSSPVLPLWAQNMLKLIAQNEKAAHHAVQAVTRLLYNDLVRDAIPHAFSIITSATGESFGTDEEIQHYADLVLTKLNETADMDLSHSYVPLLLGGLVVYDRVVKPGEDLGESLREMSNVIDERMDERKASNEMVFTLARDLVNRSLLKFGIQI